MKKFFYLLLLLFCFTATVPMLTSCEKSETDAGFLGESEDDYKSAEYTFLMTYGGTTTELSREVFATRKLAEAAFDAVVAELKNSKEYTGTLKLQLKRGNGIIKSATLTF